MSNPLEPQCLVISWFLLNVRAGDSKHVYAAGVVLLLSGAAVSALLFLVVLFPSPVSDFDWSRTAMKQTDAYPVGEEVCIL